MDPTVILRDYGVSGLLAIALVWISRQLVAEFRAFRIGILKELTTIRVELERNNGRLERILKLPPESLKGNT